jgi:hypothetical protein
MWAAYVNFQPSNVPVPPGYLVDNGMPFGQRGHGFSYGWNGFTGGARDRNSVLSPDQRYDTLIHMKSTNPNPTWEIALPDGTYSVHIVAGDAGFWDSVYRIEVEGVLAIDGVPASSNRWLESTVVVSVTDGRLTVYSAAGASNNKLNFIDIEAVAGP